MQKNQENPNQNNVFKYEQYLIDYKRRSTFRQQNLESDTKMHQIQPKKNAQFKAIQKFICKLKVEQKNAQALLSEMDQLNLSKFVEEISAILASTVTQKDIPLYIEIATKINVTYENFPQIIVQDINKNFNTAFESPDDNKQKMKGLLMFLTELNVCGFTFSYKIIVEVLKKVFQSGNKKKNSNFYTEVQRKLYAFFYSCQTFACFLVQYCENFTKATPKWVASWQKEGRQTVKLGDHIPNKVRDELTAFFFKYVSQCNAVLEASFEKIKELQDSLKQSLKKQGQINKDTERKYSDLIQKFTGTRKSLYIIVDALSFQEPIIGKQAVLTVDEIVREKNTHLEGVQIFEDEFQKQLYLNIPIFTNIQNKNAGQVQYKQFREKLEACKTISEIDSILQDFSKVNNKKTRKMLAKDVIDYRRQFQLISPYICRLVTAINGAHKDIGEMVIQAIFQQYDKLQQSPSVQYSLNNKKTRNIKYICEFTKFKVIDSERTLACIRQLIEDLKGYNIQLLITALDKVGRFLYINASSANKFAVLLTLLDNVIKKSAFSLFTTSQLSNSISLIKPHFQQKLNQTVIVKTPIQQKAQSIFQKSIINDLDYIIEQISTVLQTEEGVQAVLLELMTQIQKYQYLGIYNYVYMLEQLQSQKLEKLVIQKTYQKLQQAIQAQQNQKSLFWARFYAQTYSYGLIKRSTFYATISDLMKKQTNYITRINAICVFLEVCYKYLDCTKVSSANQRFMMLVDFKRYISNCQYVPMFEEFQIIDALDLLNSDLTDLSIQQIDKFLAYAQNKKSKNELDLEKQLNKWIEVNQLRKTKKKAEDMVDTRQLEKQSPEKKEIQNNVEFNMAEFKAFENEFTSIQDKYNKDFSNRISKPMVFERQIEKKKKKVTLENVNTKTITIIGRSGNKIIKKQVPYNGADIENKGEM